MNISKKKKTEFDEIFKIVDSNNIFINIDLFRNLFESDFFEHFLFYVENKMDDIIKTIDTIIIHTNINSLSLQDTYNYNKIIKFSKLLHKYTSNINKIILYGSSTFIVNLIKLISMSIGSDISYKIFFSNDTLFMTKKIIKEQIE